MQTLLRFLFLAAAGIAANPSIADPVDIPCSQCPVFQRPPVPESGFWHNPLQTGSGFSLELQHRKLAGGYFGFTADGRAVWYTFSGQMVRAGSADAYAWSVDADAYESRGGACLGCAYVAPGAAQAVAHLRFEFLQRSLARFRVGEGPWTLIQPFTYGVVANLEFAPEVSFAVPDLEGPWVLVFQKDLGYGDEFSRRAYFALAYGFGGPPVDDRLAYYGFFEPVGPPELQSVGNLKCDRASDGTPICKYISGNGNGLIQQAPGKEFILPLGNLSDSRFKGEAADGETVEGFRIDHD